MFMRKEWKPEAPGRRHMHGLTTHEGSSANARVYGKINVILCAKKCPLLASRYFTAERSMPQRSSKCKLECEAVATLLEVGAILEFAT